MYLRKGCLCRQVVEINELEWKLQETMPAHIGKKVGSWQKAQEQAANSIDTVPNQKADAKVGRC
jgi:hypothetical protein